MHNVIKITSLAARMAMCSACTQAESPSTQSQTHSSEHHQSGETKSHSDTAETTHSGKAAVSDTRSAESHTHGDASLAIVLDGSMLTVELDTPLYNVLGFEHKAETAAQKAALLKAETVLTRGGPLFVFNSEAGCSIIRDTISVELEHHEDEDHEGDHDDHEDEEHEDHESDEHNDQEDDHREDDHEDEESHDETHKDVVLQYDYKCQSPTALKNVTVNLFEHFENLTELDLVYLGPNTQKQSELSAAKPRMNLTR